MSNTVELNFLYSEKEYVSAIRYYLNRTYHTRFNIVVALLVTCAGVALWAMDADAVLSYVFMFLGAILLLVCFYTYFAVPLKWYRQNSMWRDEYQLQFSDEGIAFRTKDVESNLKWSIYQDVWETDKFYFLIYGKNLFSLIPKRAFANEWQERSFKEMLRRHIVANVDDDDELLESAKEEKKEYVPKSLEPPDWR